MKTTASKILFVTIGLLTCFTCWSLSAQTTDTLYHIETNDGNEYIGIMVEQGDKSVKIKTEKLGVLTILRGDIKSITPIRQAAMKSGKYWFDNPQASRYFWQPNGYGLKKGEGYYQNVWIFGNQISAGVTDHFSIGVGLVPLFLFGGAPTPVWITPKFSIPIQKDKVNVGVGILAGTVLGASSWGNGTHDVNANFGIAYGVTTFGSRDKNLSLGLGYGYAAGSWASSPTVTLSFMIRTGDRGYVISENYLINNVALLSFGGRRIIKKVAIDFGLMMPAGGGIDTILAYPWLGISVPFQMKKNKG